MASRIYTEEKLKEAVSSADSIMDVIRFFDKQPSGGLHNHITRLIKVYNIDTSHFTYTKSHEKSRKAYVKKHYSEHLVLLSGPNAERKRSNILSKAMQEAGIEYKCSNTDCGISEWRGDKITLDVDHIDGNPLDCRLHNLRFLCPNCHRQTPTFGNKKREYSSELYFCSCGKPKNRQSKTCATCYSNRGKAIKETKYYCSNETCKKEIKTKSTYCPSCYHESRRGIAGKTKITWPPVDELIASLQKSNYTQLSKQLGVTDNAIRKHLRNAGYDTKTLTKTI